MSENRTELMMYQTEDGQTKIDVRMENETVWLSLDQMAELFQRDKSTISRHIRNIFAEGELDREAVVAKFATTASDGKTYQVDFYNLDVIISVGYRVRSLRGTQFRIWANSVLKEYLIKGFAMNDDRLLPYTDLWENAFLSFTLQQQRPQLCKKRVGPACRIKPLAL